jgi:hypothetical protein
MNNERGGKRMKKLLISLLFPLVLLSSCTNNNVVNHNDQSSSSVSSGNSSVISEDVKSSSQVTKPALTIKDYYPFKENTKYVYEGKGNEYASFSVFTDYIVNNRVQLRKNNGGTETVKVLENKDGALSLLLSKSECYYRENLTQIQNSNAEIILKEPLIKGTTWTLSNNRKRTISNMDVEITTLMGKYKTIEVTTEEDKTDKTIDYYAPNIGLVKSVFSSNGVEISSTLSKIEQNAPLTQTIKFYYPNANVDKLYFVNKQLSFKTNDITRTILEKSTKDLTEKELAKVLTTNAKINSLFLYNNSTVYVDFSKEFRSEMNAGSGYEALILQSITNTLGVYYGVDKVYITVDGNPYSSGHIGMKKGEAFTVDLKNISELN